MFIIFDFFAKKETKTGDNLNKIKKHGNFYNNMIKCLYKFRFSRI